MIVPARIVEGRAQKKAIYSLCRTNNRTDL